MRHIAARGAIVTVFLILIAGSLTARAQTSATSGPPAPVQPYPTPTPGWDTASSHPGDTSYHQPAYPIAFVRAPVVETTQAMCKVGTSCTTYTGTCSGTVYPNATLGNYHVGADVLSANDPDRGNELWIYLPSTGQVKKLFPRASHYPGLIDFPLGDGSVIEPNLSEDGTRIYFSYFQDATDAHSTGEYLATLSLAGADLYAIDIGPLLTNPFTSIDSLIVTRLTTRTYNATWPTYQQSQTDRNKAAMNPSLAVSTSFNKTEYGTVFMHPTEVRTRTGLHLAYVSNKRRLDNSNSSMGRQNHNFNLHFAPILPDGTLGPEDDQLQYYTTTSALSPSPLRNGLAFSYQASTDEARMWHIQGMNSEGRWYPIIGYGSSPELFHLSTFCVTDDNGIYEDRLVAIKYYNANNEGFGSLWTQDLSIIGKNTYNNTVQGQWKVPRQVGSQELTVVAGGSLSQDDPAPKTCSGQYCGKFTSPRCGGVDQLYFSYSPTSANGRLFDAECNKDRYRARIDYRGSLAPFAPGSGSKIVIKVTADDANLLWPVPIVPWSVRSHGDATQQVAATPVITPGADILPGQPFSRVGTSALWNTDRRPFECYLVQPATGPPRWWNPWGVFGINQEHDLITGNQDGWTWVTQGPGNDFCVFPPQSQILGLAINITSNKANYRDSSFGYTSDGVDFDPSVNHYGRPTETSRLLGIYDVRNHTDQSVLALIPSHTPIEFQALDSTYGMKLTDVRSWHSLKPRETRTDCGGCHQHNIVPPPNPPPPFEQTYAAGQPPLDLVRATTTISYDPHCTIQVDLPTRAPAVDYPEWRQDIWPLMDAYCGSCHNTTTGNGTGNAALSWPDTSVASGNQVYEDIGNRQFASANRGAIGSQLFWAARGRRTDNRDNSASPANYACTSCSAKARWGFYYSSAHDTLSAPGGHPCVAGDAAYAAWLFKLGKWIDNHLPRDTGNAYGYKFDWYHPTADTALSTSNCAATQLRVGWWDDTNKLKSISVLLDDNAGSPLYFQQAPDLAHAIPNGDTLVALPSVSPSDWVTVEVRDFSDNRQIYHKRIDQLVTECTPAP